MKKVLFDTNVILDISLRRETFREASEAALQQAAIYETALLAPHSFATVHYLNERYQNRDFALNFSQDLLKVLQLSDFSHQDALNAFDFNSGDYEDALIVSAAVSNDADMIVTRNPIDFALAPIPVITPEDLIAQSK